LLKTQAKVQFDRAVTERSKAIFPVFQGFNRGQFQPSFSVFSIRSAEGRNCPKARGAPIAAPQIVILNERSNRSEGPKLAQPFLYPTITSIQP
jgi:hypothetical protein